MAEVSEEFDFLQGSMKELAMKMGEIDDVLAEISAPEESKVEKEKEKESEEATEAAVDSPAAPEPAPVEETVLPTNPNLSYDDGSDSDYSDDDDGDDGGLTDLQGELRQFESMDRVQLDFMIRGTPAENAVETPVSAIVNKPTPTSPVGISMKTKKGITRIVGISETGLLAKSDLRVGNILLKINNISIKNAKHARYIIQNATDKVHVEAKQISEA